MFGRVRAAVESPGDLFCLHSPEEAQQELHLKLAERQIGKEMITEVDQDIQRWRPKTSARTSKGAKAVGEYCSNLK